MEEEMKNTIVEFANETTTTSSGISTEQGKVWINEILEAAKKKMFFEQFARVVMCPKGNKDIAVPIAYTNRSFTSTTTEAAVRTLTEITNLNAVTFTPATQKLGVWVAKDVVDTSQVDTLAFIREQMAYDAALKIDTAFATALDAVSSPAATLYGGTATNTTTLAAGDKLSTTLIAKAQRYLKANGWFPEVDKPFVLFIPAVCEEALLRDAQFVYAYEYGSNQVVLNGEIGSYLGTKIIVSEQCTSASTWGGGAVAGHACYFVKAKVAYGIAYRDRPSLDYEYRKNEACYGIYLDMCFQCKTLQENAIVLIKVTDA